MATAKINVKVNGQDNGATKAISGVGSSFGKMTAAVAAGTIIANAATKAFEFMAEAMVDLVKSGFDQFRSIQSTVAGIKALTGNTKDATKVMKDMIEVVQGTPFDRMDTLGAARQLLAFGRTAKQVKGDVQLLGRAVIISGGEWDQLSNIFGKVANANRLTGQEMQRLDDLAIPNLRANLAKLAGVELINLNDAISEGSVDFETFKKAMDISLPANAIEEASNTVNVKLSSVSASFRDLAFEILGVDWNQMEEGAEPLVEEGGLLDKLTDGFDSLVNFLRSDEVKEAFRTIGNIAEEVFTWIEENVPKAINGVQKAWQEMKPDLEALWKDITEKLIPDLKKFWKEIVEPLIPVLGVVLVGAIKFVVGAVRGLIAINHALVSAWTWLKDTALDVWDKIKTFFQNVKFGFEEVKNKVTGFIQSIIDKIMEIPTKAGEAANAIKEIPGKIGGGIGGFLNKISPIQFKAEGGNFEANRPMVVGERGPELLMPRSSGTVIPNHELGGGTTNINVNIGLYAGSPMERRKIAEMLMRDIRDVASKQGKSAMELLA